MLLELHIRKDAFVPGSVSSAFGSSTYLRLKAGEGEFQSPEVTVGFVLNHSPQHEMAFGQTKLNHTPLNAGEGWVIPAGLDGKARWSQETDFVSVHFSASALAKVNDGVVPSFQLRTNVLDPVFVRLSMSLHEMSDVSDTVDKMYRDTTMFTLAAHVNRLYGGVDPRPLVPRLDPRLQRAISHANAQCHTDLTLEDLSKTAAMSPFHFARSFKRATGLPPHQYVTKQRIELAKSLLRDTPLPVTEVANRAGYENVSHFIRLFKRLTGGTPGEFRRA